MAEQFGEWFASWGWVDGIAVAILILFAVLGLIRGMVWQVGRVLTLAGAYAIAAGFGESLGNLFSRWLPAGAAPEIGLYTAYFAIFLAVLILLSVLSGVVHRALQDSPLSFANRIGGGLCGIATGGLIVLALLTGVQMAHGLSGLGSNIAEAASVSESRRVGDEVLAATGKILPEDWRDVTTDWRFLLGGERGSDLHDVEPLPTTTPSDASRRD